MMHSFDNESKLNNASNGYSNC